MATHLPCFAPAMCAMVVGLVMVVTPGAGTGMVVATTMRLVVFGAISVHRRLAGRCLGEVLV